MKQIRLIFDWEERTSSGTHKWLSRLIVAGLFAFILSFFNVPMTSVRSEVADGVTAFQLGNEGMGRSLAQIAEEQGPFPGRLEVADGVVEGSGSMWDKLMAGRWALYEPSLKELEAAVGSGFEGVSPRGVRTFPDRVRGPVATVDGAETARLVPRLIAYDGETSDWFPERLPEFSMPEEGPGAPDVSRFLLSLRADGTVDHSISLGGNVTPIGVALEDWLRGVRFREGEDGRWLGLRVEFVNEEEDGF